MFLSPFVLFERLAAGAAILSFHRVLWFVLCALTFFFLFLYPALFRSCPLFCFAPTPSFLSFLSLFYFLPIPVSFRSHPLFPSLLFVFSYFLVVLAYPILAIYSAYIYKALLIQDAAFRRFVRGLIRRVLSLVYSLSAFLQWAANSNLKPKREYLIVFLQRLMWRVVSLRCSRCWR